MKQSKRILALVLSVLFALTFLPLSAGAAVKIAAPKKMFVDIGGTAQITIQASDNSDVSALPLTYSSANQKVATVDETGLITGVAKGSTTVTVAFGKQTAKISVNVSESMLSFTDNKTFSINYPATWKCRTDIASNVKTLTFPCMFFSPQAGSGDTYLENVQVAVEQLPSSPVFSLSDYTAATIHNCKILNTNFKLLANKKVTLSGLPGNMIQYTCTLGQYKIKAQGYYTIKNNIAYAINYVAETKNFDKYAIEAERAMSSFQFLN